MPLSEHEERILAEIERQLEADDPRFGKRRRGLVPFPSWSRTTRLRLAVVLAVLGVPAVLTLTRSLPVAAVGMAFLLAAIVIGAGAVRERIVPTDVRAPSPDDVI